MTKRVDGYTLAQKIGKGNYGTVYRATHQSKSGEFAVKVIASEVVNSNAKLQQCLINEVDALAKVDNCQFIIKYYEMIRTKNNFYFVYEFCNGGNLYDYMQSQGPLPEKKALQFFKQLVQAFKVLNRLNVMHRDLKPDNIFLHNGKAKLGDFGFCKALKVQQNMAKTMLGSPIYMAPQVLKGESYSTKADVWSLGVIVYEMLYGVCPFQSNCIAALVSKVTSTQISFPTNIEVSEKTKAMIRKMLNKDALRRSSWVELFKQQIDCSGNYTTDRFQDSYDIRKQRRDLSMSPLKEAKSAKGHSQDKCVFASSFKKQNNNSGTFENKENKLKQFHSQKYMDLLALSNKTINLVGNQPIASRNTFNKRPSITITGQLQNDSKARKCYQKYKQCENIMKLMCEELKNRNKATVGYSYLVLTKVHSIFHDICTELPSDKIQFVNTLKYEMIQINREISTVRQQILSMKVSIPISDSINSELDQRIHNFLNTPSLQSETN